MVRRDADKTAERQAPHPEGRTRNVREQGAEGSNTGSFCRGASSTTAPQERVHLKANAKASSLMEAALARENMASAYRRVVSNRGAPGVDKMPVEALLPYLQVHWPGIKEQLLDGRYQPQPVRIVEIPKPGGGVRMLGIPTCLDRRRGQAFCRYADDCNIYVCSKAAGERVMASITRFLEQKLRLKVNQAKSAVARPWSRKFLGYSMTMHKKPRLKVASESVRRLKQSLKEVFRRGRGWRLDRLIETLRPKLLGWIAYFKLSEVKGVFDELDGWIRRRLRCVIWRHWKRSYTRAKHLMKRGLSEAKAWISATNGRGPWWNAGASHMNEAFRAGYFARLGLVSLQQERRRLQSLT